MTRYDTSTIHRYLDGVFADIPLTPEVQDLKEEIRGNLSARVAELESGGADAGTATRKAIRELGDVKEIIDQLGVEKGGADKVASPSPRARVMAAYTRNRVLQRPGYVVGVVVLSLATVAGAVGYFQAVVEDETQWAEWFAPLGVAVPIGLLVAYALRQETTANHPLPTWRAVAFGGATVAAITGPGLLGLFPHGDPTNSGLVLVGVSLVVVAIVAFSYLGATQTNRMKAWAREVEGAWMTTSPTRLEDDPAAAARFGIYSGILWIVAIGAFIALSIGDGFRWSWLALLGALLIQMAMVARMVFPDGMAQQPRPDIME